MTDLVSEDRLQLRLVQLLNQRIEENNLSEPSKARKKRIRMSRALAAIHHLDGLGAESSPMRKSQKALPQAAFRKRSELVEQGHNENRGQDHHQKFKTK